jgi:hypothetical protein
VDIRVGYRNPMSGKVHVGLILFRNDDVQVWTTRTNDSGLELPDDEGEAVLQIQLDLTAGEYYLSGYLLDESCEQVLDQRLAWTRFKVRYDGMNKGIYRPKLEWKLLQKES